MFQEPTLKAFDVDIEKPSTLIQNVVSPAIIPPKEGTLNLLFRIEWTFKTIDFNNSKTLINAIVRHDYNGRLYEALDKDRFTELFEQSYQASCKRLHDELSVYEVPYTAKKLSAEEIADFGAKGFESLKPYLNQ